MNGTVQPLPRCCSRHGDWKTLADHLCRDFPSVPAREIVRGLLEAQSVAERFQLDEDDALDNGELMVRYRLMLTTGELVDAARTDPQTHVMSGAA